jgi:hypothetical protein
VHEEKGEKKVRRKKENGGERGRNVHVFWEEREDNPIFFHPIMA